MLTWLDMLVLLLGLALGAALGWFAARSRLRDPDEAQRRRAESAELRAATAEAQRDALRGQLEAGARDRDALADRFRVLSQETLDAHGERADEAANARLEQTSQLLGPVAESLREVNERLLLVEKERSLQSERLRAEVEGIRRGNEQLRVQTAELVTALRKPQVRGAWGETQLRRVAELAGMVDHCDFDTQTSFGSGSGALRPDMRICLGEGREIFVDSKAPLTAFLDAAAESDPDAAQASHRRFAKHVKTHIDALGGKQYWSLTELPSPEFVVLFLPGEGFLQAALDGAPDLYEYASSRGVVIATPTTLIALLRTVAHVWRQQELARNATAIIRTGRELYDRLATASGHLGAMGHELNSAVVAYNRLVGSLETRVMPSARRLSALGISSDELASVDSLEMTARPLVAADWAEPATDVLPQA